MTTAYAAAKAVFEAGLPHGPNGELKPNHTKFEELGLEGKKRYQRMAKAALIAWRDSTGVRV